MSKNRRPLKDALRFQYQFFLMMQACGRDDMAQNALVKLDALIDSIDPSIKVPNPENLKQVAK